MLGLVGIPEPRRRADAYPHEFSGGMRQRAMIAMALANDPKLLIADEPTTALDVTVQAQILELIERLQEEFDTAVVIITHDLGVVAEIADDIAVMYAGRIVEKAPTDTIFDAPEHPYTWGLLRSIPRLDTPRDEELVPIPGRPPSLITLPGGCSFHPRCPYVREAHKRVDPTLEPVAGDRATRSRACSTARRAPAAVARSSQAGQARRSRRARASSRQRMRGRRRPAERRRRRARPCRGPRPRQALPDHAGHPLHRQRRRRARGRRRLLRRQRGETLGIVGESGCGKSTTARLLMRLLEPTSGSIKFDGREIADRQGRGAQGAAPRDADDLPGPVLVAEPAQDGRHDHRRAVRRSTACTRARRAQAAVQELMDLVGLNPEHYNRYPHEFSGGQRQRIGVARALALKPKLIIADEPVSALDVSIQAQILNLLRDLQRELGLTLVFIAHDLSVVRHMCDRIAVMYLGKIVELADVRRSSTRTRASLHGRAAVRGAGRRPAAGGAKKRQILAGDVPSPTNPPPACRVPHALPEGAGDLRHRRAAAGGQGRRQHRRLPLPAHGRRGRRADPHARVG